MSDSRPKRDVVPEQTAPRNTGPQTDASRNDRRDVNDDADYTERDNPKPATKTAAKSTAFFTATFWPGVLLFLLAVALIVYFGFMR